MLNDAYPAPTGEREIWGIYPQWRESIQTKSPWQQFGASAYGSHESPSPSSQVGDGDIADVMLEATVTLAFWGRSSKALRMAVGHWFDKISQASLRSVTGPEVGVVCVRARRKKEVVVRWMNFMVVVGKNWN